MTWFQLFVATLISFGAVATIIGVFIGLGSLIWKLGDYLVDLVGVGWVGQALFWVVLSFAGSAFIATAVWLLQ